MRIKLALLFICASIIPTGTVQAVNGYLDHIAVTYVRNGHTNYDQTVSYGSTVTYDTGTGFAILVYHGGGTEPWTYTVTGPGGYSETHSNSGSYSPFPPNSGWLYTPGQYSCKVDNDTWKYIVMQEGSAQPAISNSPMSLSNSCQQGQNAASQSFEIWNSGAGTLSYTVSDNVSWLSCSPTSGSSTGGHNTITVNYTTSGLTPGTYNAQITVSDPNATNSPRTISVSLTVTAAPQPTISVSPTSLSPSCPQGQNAASQSFEVWNSGAGTLSYSISDNVSWLSCSPTSGSSTGEHDTIAVSYSTSGLSPGTYPATITISATGATNSPQTIGVTLTVSSPPEIRGWVLFDHDNDPNTDPVALKGAKLCLVQNHDAEHPLGTPQYSGENGYFTFGNTYSALTNLTIYVYSSNSIVQVNHYSWPKAVRSPYVYWKPISGGGTYTIRMSGDWSLMGAFAIFQYVNDLNKWFSTETQRSKLPTDTSMAFRYWRTWDDVRSSTQLNVFWTYGQIHLNPGANGLHEYSGNKIFLSSSGNALDISIIYPIQMNSNRCAEVGHEYGHFIHDQLGGDDAWGGRDTDPWAFREGLSHYMGRVGVYSRNEQPWAVHYNYRKPDKQDAVFQMLWDLYDTSPNSDGSILDDVQRGFQYIWYTLLSGQCTRIQSFTEWWSLRASECTDPLHRDGLIADWQKVCALHGHGIGGNSIGPNGGMATFAGMEIQWVPGSVTQETYVAMSSVVSISPNVPSKIYELMPLGESRELNFSTNAVLGLGYDGTVTADEGRLSIHYYNPEIHRWEPLPSTVDTEQKKVTAPVSHLSEYAVGLPELGIAPAQPQGFALSDNVITSGSVDFTWTANSEADLAGYLLKITKAGDTNENTENLDPNCVSYLIKPIEPGDYTFTLYAYDVDGNRSDPAVLTLSIVDTDTDGLPDAWEQAKLGGAGFGAADDNDEDGANNLTEYQCGTDPRNRDNDVDGMPDGWEIMYGLNPLDPSDANQDPDNDRLSNRLEYQCQGNPRDSHSPSSMIYVDVANAADQSQDGTREHPFAAIQAAINAIYGEGTVVVSPGIYYEHVNVYEKGVTLTSTDPYDRNVVTSTIIDGSGNGTVVTFGGGETSVASIRGFTIRNGNAQNGGGICCSNSSATISNNVIRGNVGSHGGGILCEDSSSLITNNTIIGNSAESGGGICCVSGSPTIRNNTINGNAGSDGGGIYCWGSSPTISSNTISGNFSLSNGGGIYCEGSSPSIANNIIAFNEFVGIYSRGGTPVLRNNCVVGSSNGDYQGVSAGTGDIKADPKMEASEYGQYYLRADSPCINAGSDTDVQSGQVDVDGRPRIVGAHVDIGADEYDGKSHALFTSAIIRVSPTGNDANDGSSWAQAKRTVQAGIDAAAAIGAEVWVAEGTYYEWIDLKPFAYLYGGFAGTETERDQRNFRAHVTVLDGQQQGSVVTARRGYRCNRIDGFTIRNGIGFLSGGNSLGGGILCDRSSPIITNNLIIANGGGIYCYWSFPIISNNIIISSYPAFGGGIWCDYSSPVITNNTIIGNSVGIYCFFPLPSIIANNIVALNGTGIYRPNGVLLVLRNNCVFNPWGTDYIGCSAGVGDIKVDPCLMGDQNWIEYPREYCHLKHASPCVDAGNDADVHGWVDVDGQPRINGSHVDIGADEWYPIPGDANGDRKVNFSDYLFLSENYGATGASWGQGDFNGDTLVDFSDYLILMQNFGSSGGATPEDTALLHAACIGLIAPTATTSEPSAENSADGELDNIVVQHNPSCAPLTLIILTMMGVAFYVLGMLRSGDDH